MNAKRWAELMIAWRFPGNESTHQALVAAYAEPHRRYHNGEHVDACLRELDRCPEPPAVLREVELALWFHDAIYSPLRAGNEQRSADWAVAFLKENQADHDAKGRVSGLILATLHDAPAQTDDEALLVDIDLSILGQPASVYERFERAIRQEYRLVPWFIYRKKRAEVLRGFLDRTTVYQTESFRRKYEDSARDNLERAINALRIKSPAF